MQELKNANFQGINVINLFKVFKKYIIIDNILEKAGAILNFILQRAIFIRILIMLLLKITLYISTNAFILMI